MAEEEKAEQQAIQGQVIERPILGVQTGTEVLVPPDGNWQGGIPRTCSKVAIVGFAPSSMSDVKFLFGDPDVEIWGINQLYMAFPDIVPGARSPEQRNVTRWFQIHSRQSYDQTVARDHSHHEWLGRPKEVEFPIYMQKREPDVPSSVEFPKDMLMAEFGRYFTNSISWEIALAIHEGFKTIYIFGVDMAQDSEHAYERPSVEFFCGWARGAGINLVMPQKSDLLKTAWIYPYEDDAPMRIKFQSRRGELRDRINQAGMTEQNAHDERMQLMGALENMNYIEKAWISSARLLEGFPPINVVGKQ